MRRILNPPDIARPFGRYSHGLVLPAAGRLVVTSGQLGITADGRVPADVGEQADLCFNACARILAEAGLTMDHVVRINAYVTRREDFAAYMAVRDRWVGDPPPASTLLIVSGFTRPEFLVEVEITALGP